MVTGAPKIPDAYDRRTFVNIIGDLQKQIDKVSARVGVYQVTNSTDLRTIDIQTATQAQINEFFATVITDLIAAGRLGS